MNRQETLSVQFFLRVAAIIYLSYLIITLLVISPALNLLPHKYMLTLMTES
jgi:hypothetical protein